MAKQQYKWVQGARLEEHSRRKHKILREYIFDYLTVRCSLPQQRRFRLAIVDGFAGAGRYECGEAGSPLIFMQELKRAVDAVNTRRGVQGLGMVEVECLLIFNDQDYNAIEKKCCARTGQHHADMFKVTYSCGVSERGFRRRLSED